MPRAIHAAGRLAGLITDVWVPESSVTAALFPRRLRERFHPGLADAHVDRFNARTVSFEAIQRLRRVRGWRSIVARNDWYQERAIAALKSAGRRAKGDQPVLFAYSYAARHLLAYAKRNGWRSVLGQIDAGPVGFEQHAHANALAGIVDIEVPPASYWDEWREECELADTILVNSEWSAEAVKSKGIAEDKIRVVPLAYEAPRDAAYFVRRYPTEFSSRRPLRLLFLGQINAGKGAGVILEAMSLLVSEPVEVAFVGERRLSIDRKWLTHNRVRWVGGVPRSDVASHYKKADVFLFPTFSDGFGLTQLEAQAWKLPIIASRFCGDVVKHSVNGLHLDEVTPERLAAAVISLIRAPERLQAMSAHSSIASFSVGRFQSRLLEEAAR